MNTEQNQKVLLEQLEALKKENEQLKKELSILRNENISNRPVSFKEKYAVRILDSLPDMLTVFNQNEVGIEVVSNEETNHVGISNKDFKGMYMREMVPPEAYQNIHSNMRQAVSTGAVSTAHHELDFNGEHHHYENRIFPLDEEYVLIMCRDITERVTTQRQLEVFKSVLDKVSDSILAVSEDGTLVYANKQFIEEYGVTQQMGTQKIYDLPVSMTTKEAWERRLQEIRDNDGTFAYRAAYMRKGEDKERMHQVSTFLIRENNEELTWFFTQDITDVIKKQDELRELNLLLDGILNNIPVYLFVKDPENDFRYLYWNKAFADHSGIPASKAIGHTDYEVFPSHGDAEKFRKDDLELLQTHKRIDMQETYLSANGEARIVQTLKALVPMEGRKPLLIGISWDITNLQNIEQELIKARIKAEQSDRLKSAFLANMSHEIRTPLNAIVGFSQLLPSAETAEEKKLYSGIINQNSDILLQLINDILDLSKIEAGTLEYIKRRMNLGEVCRTIYAVHKERVKEGVTLVFDNEEEDLLMEGDQNRIMQVITNFLTNASKFTYEGEIRFGSQSISDIQKKELYRSIALIHQNVVVLDGTLRDNVSLYESYSDENIKQALIRAGMGDYLNETGLDFTIQESGSNLSGGEKQRIAIARAFLRNTPVMILDEATSSLDSLMAAKIEQTVLQSDTTILNIVHQLKADSLKQYDEILVFSKGAIIERGNYDELIQKDGIFRSLLSVMSA